ncbi:MAG: rod shape-determining protein MreC [Caulobacteraceae bacterium]
MSYRDGHFQDLKVPLTWTVGVAVVVAAVAAVALLLSDRRETLQSGVVGVARAAADIGASPVGQAVSAPGRWTGQATQYVKDYFGAVSQNRRLRAENAELRQWKATAIALEDTNARYRALLGFKTNPPIPMASAHVILDSRGPFADTRLADAGKEKGVEVGNPVMNERGLVGRVIGVAQGASRVLLLSDVASRTPVLIDRTDARAILTGDASATPKLEYLRGVDPIKEGDRILSSGDGGMIPRGLPVGTAVKGLDGAWRVRLDADASSIDFVRILLFKDFSLLASQQDLAQTTVPAQPAPAPTPAAKASPPPAAASSTPGAVSIAAPRPVPTPASPAVPAASSDKAE